MRASLLVVAAIVLSGCMAKPGANADSAHCAPPSCMSEWALSLNGSTKLAADLSFDVGQDNTCSGRVDFVSNSNSPRPVMTMFEVLGGNVIPEATAGWLSTAHAETVPVPRESTELSGGIYFENRSLSGIYRVIPIGNDLSLDASNGKAPFQYRFSCVNPFALLNASTSVNAILWEAGYMGGDGIATRPLIPYIWTTHQTNGRVHVDTEAGQYTLLLAGNYEERLQSRGNMTLTGPGVEEHWEFSDQQFQAIHAAADGGFDLVVNYDGTGSPDRLIGILGSFEPQDVGTLVNSTLAA